MKKILIYIYLLLGIFVSSIAQNALEVRFHKCANCPNALCGTADWLLGNCDSDIDFITNDYSQSMNPPNDGFIVIIRHRNHLAISSITLPNTQETKYDFTTSITQAKGNSQMRQLPSGKFAMCAGDFNDDGKIGGGCFMVENIEFTGAVGIDWIRYD